MSNDSYINSALFNFCNSLDNGPREPRTEPPRSLEDLAWLKEALQSIEAPDKILKKHLEILKRCVILPNSPIGKKPSSAAPMMIGGGPSKSSHTSTSNDNTVSEKAEEAEKPTETTAAPPQELKKDYPKRDEIINSLQYLECELEDINMSMEFCLMDGPAIILALLQVAAFDTKTEGENPAAGDAEVRYLTAMCIAHATQQHPKAQECFVALSWESVVVPMLALEVGEMYNGFTRASRNEVNNLTKGPVTVDTVAALIHACSCMSRECDHGSHGFISNGGLDILNFILTTAPSINASSGIGNKNKQPCPSPCYMLCTPKIVKRVLFLVEYFASVGISNTDMIVNVSDLASMVTLDGTEKNKDFLYVEVLEKSSTMNFVLMAEQTRQVAIEVLRTSHSSEDKCAAPSNIDSGIDKLLSVAGDKCVITCSRGMKNDLQISACKCLMSLLHSGKDVVKDIVQSTHVVTFLEVYLTGAVNVSYEGVSLSKEEDPRMNFYMTLLK